MESLKFLRRAQRQQVATMLGTKERIPRTMDIQRKGDLFLNDVMAYPEGPYVSVQNADGTFKHMLGLTVLGQTSVLG